MLLSDIFFFFAGNPGALKTLLQVVQMGLKLQNIDKHTEHTKHTHNKRPAAHEVSVGVPAALFGAWRDAGHALERAR